MSDETTSTIAAGTGTTATMTTTLTSSKPIEDVAPSPEDEEEKEEEEEEEEEEEGEEEEEDVEDSPTLSGSADMDLVNGPNPWLPAYGFQLQHHSHFQPTHEDLRTNDTVLVQQVDFLETILEETSDDLQSDSDRSGTTYWLGSDSETESVIHIKAKQRSADDRLDGSGSECNSVVPKKRRRRNDSEHRDHPHHPHHQVAFEDFTGSPRSSRSTASSRSSSLLQFESLERTCATLSPSSYSFDSLEYSNRSNASHPENTSPDSLEQEDYDRPVPNGFPGIAGDRDFPRIRPYRSFESLDTCQKDDEFGQGLSNGFAPLYLKRGSDLSRTRRNARRPRDFWHEDEEYEEDADDDDDDDDEEEDDDVNDGDDEYLEEDSRLLNDSRATFEDRQLIFGESTCNYATSLDYRNTIDLREIGVETRRDALMDLKSGQAAVSTSLRMLHARLNITGGMAYGRNNMVADHRHRHHHHHHHHHRRQHQHHRDHQQRQHQHQQRWSKEECFNFRFTDKSQSAPSLLGSVDESAHSPRSLAARAFPSTRTTSFVSTSNLFENYTRVASVPVDLNLCGVSVSTQDDRSQCRDEYKDDNENETILINEIHREMADITAVVRTGEEIEEKATTEDKRKKKKQQRLENREENNQMTEKREEKVENELPRSKSSVRTQAPQTGSVLIDTNTSCTVTMDVERDGEVEEYKKNKEEECVDGHCEKREKRQVTSTVKTQDRGNCVLDMAIAMENDIDAVVDEAIKQFKREVEEAVVSGNSVLEAIQRTPSGKQRARRVKNNASYELAQQFEIDEQNFRPNRVRSWKEEEEEEEEGDEEKKKKKSPRRNRRPVNNASYELAQQCDYIKTLQSSRGAFHRMDACDELEEPSSVRSSQLKVSDMVQQMSSGGSAMNLSSGGGGGRYEGGTRTYSRSTENVSASDFGKATQANHVSPQRNKKTEQEESLLTQIKKNSDLFSIYGEGASNRGLVDDEVDYPCLETKPIRPFSADGDALHGREKERIREEGDGGLDKDPTNVALYPKKSFIGEFYPENIVRLRQQDDPTDDTDSCTIESKEAEGYPAEEPPPNYSERDAIETLLWKAIAEKQQQRDVMVTEKEAFVEKVTKQQEVAEEEEKENAVKEEKEEAVEAARGHTVHGVRSSPPGRGDGGGLEPSQRSGNPAVAVAVDTNHRGDRDKRHEEKAAAIAAARVDDDATMSTVSTARNTATKRSFEVAPSSRKEPPSSPSGTTNTNATARFQRNMVVEPSTPKGEERKKGGLGGFLQRFSRLRFSGRSKVPRSEVQKKSEPLAQVNRAKVSDERKSKEPDYIIIPLHPPPEEEEEKKRKDELVVTPQEERKSDAVKRSNNADSVQRSSSNVSSNGRAPVSSKPPLPPQPPRFGALSSRPSAAAAVAGGGGGGASAASASSSRRRAATDLGNPAAIEMAKARTMQAAQERPVGLLETDLDEAVSPTTTSTTSAGKKTRSLLNLNHTSAAPGRARAENALHVPQSPVGASHRSPHDDGAAVSTINQRPHKSMEFLLDKENLHFVKPPENELQKVGERVPSEHELRVQRSLQRLNVPDWYKNSPAARDGFRLKRHSDASQHGGWRALGSKTTSLSSLSSSSNRQPTTGALLSPSPTPPVFSRWSTSLLNSAGSSPASSARSSFNHRQPYLGWRSQERLTNPRTPAERLAQGILPQLQAANKQQQQQQQQTTNQQLEVRNSIKEVTSAIVHYVQSGQEVGGGGRLSPRPRPEDWDDRGGARSTSPRGSIKLCWMESSFVGTRPMDSPETPMSLATDTDCCNATGTESCSCIDSATSGLFLDLTPARDEPHEPPTTGGTLCPSPTSSSNYHHHHRHPHHHRQTQQQHQQQRHHRGELLLA